MQRRILITMAMVFSVWVAPGMATSKSASSDESTVTQPDNSGINKRDARPEELTAAQQSPQKSDVELTRLIRKNIISHHELSTNAHNIKIITQQGSVTLKGPVGSQHEKAIVEKIAREVAGVHNVLNELQIASGE